MSNKEEKTIKKKRRSDSDGVKVKRSYYSFSKYYPGGGSSQEYRKVMVETPDEHKKIKLILSVFAVIILIYIGCFSMSVALKIADTPTTEVTTSSETTTKKSSESTTSEPKTTYEVTIEEPDRENNLTTLESNTNSTDG